MRIAYLINQYPKVSHSFIRREIQALERQGFEVERMALRGWEGDLVDAEDLRERARTRYVLRDGMPALLIATLGIALSAPGRFLAALGLALRMGRRAERAWPYHLVYLAEAARLAGWCRARRVTHLHAHFGTNSAEVAMLTRALGGPPFSFTVHGPEEFDKPLSIGLGEKVRQAAFVVAISSFGRSQLFRWVEHEHWHKLRVVHCGLEREFHEVAPTPFPTAPRLVCVGRLCEQKGQLLLLEAAGRLARKGVDFELVLAGDGELRGEVETLIDRLDLRDRTRITGWISSDRVRDEILAARAMVLPSFAEGLPVVIMEALALGRPVLSTYVAGIPELVRHGICGWLFPAGSVDDLEAALLACLAAAPEELARMGEAGRHAVLARHDIDTEAARLAALFRAGQS